MAPAKIHGWRFVTTRSLPRFSVSAFRLLKRKISSIGTLIMSLMPAIREKRFHTRCQEEVYREVKAHLAELVDEYFDDAEHCDFYLKYGSTVLEISIDPYEEDDAVIEVLAFFVQGVEPSFEMMRVLFSMKSQVPLRALSLAGNDILYFHSLLFSHMLT